MSGQRTVLDALAERLSRPVSAADRRRAALHVLDWSGCAVAAKASPAASALATVFGRGEDVGAAFFWGGLGNVLEMDDVDKRALLHPGPVVIPATLLGCRAAEAGATAFLDAIVRGYEAMICVGRAVGPGHYRFWHNTATCGPFGAAAGLAATLADKRVLVDALGLAGTQASGFWQMRHEPASEAKQLHTGRAAHAGLAAFLLARAGMVGVRTILEGPQGFFAATCPGADPAAVVAFPAGAPWAIHDVSFKPWPACRHAHPAIDAALDLRADGLRAEAVEGVVVRAYADAIAFCDKPAPRDSLSAKFSLQHAVAVALLKGPPALADFEGAALDDPATAALRRRVRVEEDVDLTARYPSRFGAAIDATLRDGAVRTAACPDALGDPENPASEEQLRAKAAALFARGGLDAAAGRALEEAALALAEGGMLEDYAACLFEACA